MKLPLPSLLLRTSLRALLLALPLALAPTLRPADATPTPEAAAKKAAEDQRIATLYQQKVATLSPERQAWEKILQENLGESFYLPLHRRDFVKGTSTAWDFVVDDPKLPRVLLIGDSVSRAYTLGVRTRLSGRANVHRAPENCGPTANGLKKLATWLASAGPTQWDVIYFNFGIHDRATPVADYSARLTQIVTRLQQTGATVIWASTTPIPDDPSKKQTAASIVERNATAAAVMARHHIAIDDLFTFITPHLAATQKPGDVHYTDRGYELLSQHVAATLSSALPAK